MFERELQRPAIAARPERRRLMDVATAVRADTGTGQQSGILVERAARGDQSAWDQLVRRYSAMLWRVARTYGLPQEDAGDAVQITWLRLAEHIQQIRDPNRISGWLLTTVRRECIPLYRRNRRVILCLDNVDVPADERDQPENVVESAAERDLLLAAFNRLPTPHRVLLAALMASPPPSYTEVARALGMPRGSVGPTRQRALARLRSEIAVLRSRPSAHPPVGAPTR
jgi:RNA polymerase sigma factor (sigma-70 family)